jgi:transcription elongation GreA/GreB family factor
MNKSQLQRQVILQLQHNLELAIRAAQTAHEAATHAENIAENKYDTLGLEAAYLAAGQARRVDEIRLSLHAWQRLPLRAHDSERGIQLGALLQLAEGAQRQRLWLGPDGAGLKLPDADGEILLITPQAPLGKQLLGLDVGDEVIIASRHWKIIQVD